VNRKERRQRQATGRKPPSPPLNPGAQGVSGMLMAYANQPTALAPDFARLEREAASKGRGADPVAEAFVSIKRRDRIDHEVEMRRRALVRRPGDPLLRHLLADALRARGDRAEAVQLYQSLLDDPVTAESARFCLACLGALPPPKTMPAQMVAALFDSCATTFDNALVHGLKYQGPGIIAGAVARVLGPDARDLDVLDAGCGTGLCGPVLRPLARRLDGIDISAAMVDQAQAKGVYHRLKQGEICAALLEMPASYDLIVAAEVVNYLGDLGPLFGAARGSLRPGGHLIFTTERAASGAYELHAAARYRHTDAYVGETATGAGLALVERVDCVLRFEQGEPVAGSVFAYRPQ
jgi:predicted TPR repeat methyltransferase